MVIFKEYQTKRMHFVRKKDNKITRASTATIIHITTVAGSYIYSYRKSSAGPPLTVYRNWRPKHTIWTQQEMTGYCGRVENYLLEGIQVRTVVCFLPGHALEEGRMNK